MTIPCQQHSFARLVWEACGEMVVEGYVRLAGNHRICIPCHAPMTGLREPRSAL